MKSAMSLALMAAAASGKVIDNEYIVVMKGSAMKDSMSMLRHFEKHNIHSDMVTGNWDINNGEFVGYAFKGSENMRLAIEEDVNVKYVEANQEVHALDCNEQEEVVGLYGLNRATNFDSDNDLVSRVDSKWGQDVRNYILDTGVRYSHDQFSDNNGLRVDPNCRSEISGEVCGEDGNGHGTHVAGTVAGNTFGVAPSSTIIDVKVLSRFGSGSFAGVINGVNWTAADCEDRKCVANMSLGGGASQSVDEAVTAAANRGVVMVLASGNSNANACNSSPARAGGNNSPNVITVNSSTRQNARSSFSNFGTCTDVFAAGSSILSAWHLSDTSTNTISGTSMASPHVAGVVSAMLSVNDNMSTTEAKAMLLRNSVEGEISNIGTGSNNRLAQVSCIV